MPTKFCTKQACFPSCASPKQVLNIETGHKTFELKASSNRELSQWHLRLQEVIMLQEKVANVAHGWLLKEETGAHKPCNRTLKRTSLSRGSQTHVPIEGLATWPCLLPPSLCICAPPLCCLPSSLR